MFIVAWSDTLSVDHWHAYENLEDARGLYLDLKNQNHIYTVSLLSVIESTDYSSTCVCYQI